eukprot:14687104-Ditylum_brightwellii.AAC.1
MAKSNKREGGKRRGHWVSFFAHKEAIGFIKPHKTRPFFYLLCRSAISIQIHLPLHAAVTECTPTNFTFNRPRLGFKRGVSDSQDSTKHA